MPRQQSPISKQRSKPNPSPKTRSQRMLKLKIGEIRRFSPIRLASMHNSFPVLRDSLLQRSIVLRAEMDMAAKEETYSLGKFLTHCTIILWLVYILMNLRTGQKIPWFNSELKGAQAPLAMDGGDPHIRALMRTISASESNVTNPYSIIYGGSRTQDLTQHPDRCITIGVGPNTGNCSTAAGRYQFITTTWQEQSKKYHPGAEGLWLWHHYSFEPHYQDVVTYRWLSDPRAWNADLKELLRSGQISTVLQKLSPTWTSLGYGIETNDMSASLPQIYQDILKEELALTQPPNRQANLVNPTPNP
jgi:muramidase (phage lysozyme)